MKIHLLSIILLIGLTSLSNLNEDRDYDYIDEDDNFESDGDEEAEHLTPDINCMVNDFKEFFGFPKKILNSYIVPKNINDDIDPFIVYLNSILEDKIEDVDFFLTIEDINIFFAIEDDEMVDLRVILDECSKVPIKYGLTIIELNYLYCSIVWKHGFELFSDKLVLLERYKNGFLKIIDTTVSEIFNYKTYIKDIKINKYTMKYW